MNLRPLLAAFALLAVTAHAAPLTPADTQSLEHDLDEMGAPAVAHHDYEKIANSTFAPVVELAGGHDSMVQKMRVLLAKIDAQHIRVISHVSESEAQSTDAGQYEVVRVQEVSVLDVAGKRLQLNSYSLAVRTKPAGAWTFIGSAVLAADPQLAWRVLPDLPKDYKLPASSTLAL